MINVLRSVYTMSVYACVTPRTSDECQRLSVVRSVINFHCGLVPRPAAPRALYACAMLPATPDLFS